MIVKGVPCLKGPFIVKPSLRTPVNRSPIRNWTGGTIVGRFISRRRGKKDDRC
jgi:hypothetical protein